MFHIGLKKEEKEMLIRTINELQELRADLAIFKNALAGIGAGERPAEAEAATVGETGINPDGKAENPGEENQGEPDVAGESGAGDPGAEESAGSGADDAGPESPLDPGETSPLEGETVFAAENTEIARDWAVVRFNEIKRPWWKFWGSRDRAVRRSV